MNRQSLTPVVHALALLAFFASFVPSASACSCRNSATGLKACCVQAGEQKACCQDHGQRQCSCSTNGQGDGSTQCRCGVKDFAHDTSPVVPTRVPTDDVPTSFYDLEHGWSVPAHIPLTLADCAIEFSLKPDVVLTYERPSAQVLLGVWRN